MAERPRSLTIVGWWLLISSVFGIYAALTAGSNPYVMDALAKSGMSLTAYRSIGTVTSVLVALSGYGVLIGQPWSRLLYLFHSILGMVMVVLTAPSMAGLFIAELLVMGLFQVVFLYLLFRPAADRWFAADWLQLQRSV